MRQSIATYKAYILQVQVYYIFLMGFKVHFKDTYTEKKNPKIKLQRLRKIRIWIFGLLVHQINSF